MYAKNKNFNKFFNDKDLTQNEFYSFEVVKSLTRSLLEPIAQENSKAVILTNLGEIEETKGLIRRLEYSTNITLKEFSDVEFSKFNVEKIGF